MRDELRKCGDVEEVLASYVDGETDPATRAAVDRHLVTCSACRDAAAAERHVRGLLHESRSGLCQHAPEALHARCARAAAAAPERTLAPQASVSRPVSRMRRWAPLSLAATLLLAVAGVFLFSLNNGVQALAAGLALDHTKCFSLERPVPGPDAAAAERAWQNDQGWPVVVPRTDPGEQLRLVDVRRCYSTDGKTCHMMYLWHGQPLSVYVLPRSTNDAAVVDRLGHEAAIWCDHDRTYAVVADGHPQDFMHIVDYVKVHAR